MAGRSVEVTRGPRKWTVSEESRENGLNAELLEAVMNNDYDSVRRLVVEKGIQPKPGSKGNTIICLAAVEGREDILNLLLDHGGNPFQPDLTDYMWLRRPIHLAACHGHVACLNALLDRGVDVNTRDSDHRTPLHWASTYGQNEAAEALILKGASVDVAQIDGFTPLHASTCLGHTQVCETLIRHSADVNRADRDSWTALHTAACYGYIDVVRLVLDAGAFIHQCNADMETALHVACSSGYLSIVELLYQRGARINQLNSNGYTPFHLSVYYNKFDIARFLVSVNADINTKNNSGQTPFVLALTRVEKRFVVLLVEAGCHITPEHVSRTFISSPELAEMIQSVATNPRSLKQLACFKIRSLLSHTLLDDIHVLPLPQSLKDYIALKHV